MGLGVVNVRSGSIMHGLKMRGDTQVEYTANGKFTSYLMHTLGLVLHVLQWHLSLVSLATPPIKK